MSARTRLECDGKRNGQYAPEVCGGCGALVSEKHKTPKSEVECRAAMCGITIERETPAMQGDPIGQLSAPDGKRFRLGEHALTFADWRDARMILRGGEGRLVSCPDDCDCCDEGPIAS